MRRSQETSGYKRREVEPLSNVYFARAVECSPNIVGRVWKG